jgi:uncharacterized membrane protein YbhN (UPF0104 family)
VAVTSSSRTSTGSSIVRSKQPYLATWQLVMAGVLQAIGLALVGLAGALLVGAKTNPFSLIFTFGGLCAFLVVAQYAASRPDALEGVGITALRGFNALRK